MHEEMLDILDDAGNCIGVAGRDQLIQNGFRNYKLVSAFVRSPEGFFYTFRRSYDKKCFGGCFASVGGCVQAGESYEEALFREIEEEIMLKKEEYTWRFLGNTTPLQDNTYGHVAVYELITSNKISYNTDDFCEMRILSLKDLQLLCQTQEVSHNLPIYVQKFYNTLL